MARRLFARLHLWVGLTLALFLIVEGLTGSLLAFDLAIEHVIDPQFFATPVQGAVRRGLGQLAADAEAQLPAIQVDYLFNNPDQILAVVSPRKARPGDDAEDQVFLDPWTGKVLGERRFGDLSQGVRNLMPFVYNIHQQLLSGTGGVTLLGIIAVLWTFDAFTSFLASLPATARGFWRRWGMAWRVKTDAGSFRLNFDLHRASGLWLWPLVLVFAWSSVMLEMPSVYGPVTKALFGYHSFDDIIAEQARHAVPKRRYGWVEAERIGRRLLEAEAAKRGATLGATDSMAFIAEYGVYSYGAWSSDDVRGERADNGIWFDADTGAPRLNMPPLGPALGNAVSTWLWGLHYGDVHNQLWYRCVVFLFGLVVAMLSATGIYIWWRKRHVHPSPLRKPRASSGPA